MSSKKIIVFIKIIGDSSSILKKLSPDDCLSDIRKELENNNIINDMLLFSKKGCEVERENEVTFHLKEIITVDNDQNILYLKRLYWELLSNKCKLDYGCTMSFDGIKIANKRAFIMRGCELNEINRIDRGQLKFESKEDWMKKTNLFFSSNINMQNFAELGSFQNENFNEEINSTYKYTELGKVSLKFSNENLGLTYSFKNDVINAIQSKDHRKFREITEKYGQFIPTEVILGGRVYFKDVKMSSENSADESKEGSVNTSLDFKIRNSSNHVKLLGGKHSDVENFNEKAWIESLINYQNWDCIEFKNPISIFQLLPDNLRKEAFESIGKRIIHTSIEDYNYYLYEPGMHGIFKLKNISQNILKIIQNEEADCDIFAAIVDHDKDFKKKVFFNCQILKKQKAIPSVIIHGIQKKFQKRKYNLKIKIMVIGYNIDFNFTLSDIINIELIKKEYESQNQYKFDNIPLQQELKLNNISFIGIPVLSNFNSSNSSLIIGHNFSYKSVNIFSYCAKKNCYDKLPKFTFYTLIISNYSTDKYEFNFKILKKPFIDKEKFTSLKYVSLYLSKDNNYNPIFLNQKSKKVNIEYVNCNCNKTCFICKNKTKKLSKDDDYFCIFFDFDSYLSKTTSDNNKKSITFPKSNDLGSDIDFITDNHFVKFIDINEFSTMTNIDGGHFGTISKAFWTKTNEYVVCKRLKNIQSIYNKQNEAFLHELQMHQRLDFCPRIIQILGISFDKITNEYLLIMQYANNGNLRKYLQNHFLTLTWKDKINLAYQIAEGIKYLHGENILHRDLHSKNIVIHEGQAKIIDLGTAKSLETETNLHSEVFGMVAYIDPKVLEDYSYKYNKKSDIYSLGVLMWELSSGYPPFIEENDNILKIHLKDGRREEIIPGTPHEYFELYKSCWDPEPNVRPLIDEVFNKLEKILNKRNG